MNINKILNEIKSPAIKEIASSLAETVERMQGKIIDYRQGSVEIAGHKHLIQSVALDWAFNRVKKQYLIENKEVK